MNTRKRKRWKPLPQLTPLEKRYVEDLTEIIQDGGNILAVNVFSTNGHHRYKNTDILNWIEKTQPVFDYQVPAYKG